MLADSVESSTRRYSVTVAPAALADALQDRYTIERELGRGGMATVLVSGPVSDLQLSPPHTAFKLPASVVTDAGFTSAGWDLAPDARRILAIDDVAPVEVTTVRVVMNMWDELRRRAPQE
jgi:hypothetical protein